MRAIFNVHFACDCLNYTLIGKFVLDHMVTFHRSVTSKANSVLGLIKRNLRNCPSSVKEAAYATSCEAETSNVLLPSGILTIRRPSIPWTGSKKDNPFLYWTILSNSECDPQHEWHSLQTLRRNARLTIMYKMCHGHLELTRLTSVGIYFPLNF